jgi:hypothetical protein
VEMRKHAFIQRLISIAKSMIRLATSLRMFMQTVYWRFRGQGFYIRNASNFREFGWSLTSKTVNWGDLLVREIGEEVFDLNAIRKAYSGAVFGGSVLSDSHFKVFQKNVSPRPILAISCGARNSRDDLDLPSNLEIHGVRGRCTSRLLDDILPTGDPGMLAPVIFDISPIQKPGFNKLHVPHFSQPLTHTDSDQRKFSTLLPYGKSSKSLVQEINSSNFVLAGSLHAGICAFATGTPFAFSLSESTEDPFKFYDFASFHGIDIAFHENFESAIQWYVSEKSLQLDLHPQDFEVLPSSLLKFVKFEKSTFRSKVQAHTISRNLIHSRKVNFLLDYLERMG